MRTGGWPIGIVVLSALIGAVPAAAGNQTRPPETDRWPELRAPQPPILSGRRGLPPPSPSPPPAAADVSADLRPVEVHEPLEVSDPVLLPVPETPEDIQPVSGSAVAGPRLVPLEHLVVGPSNEPEPPAEISLGQPFQADAMNHTLPSNGSEEPEQIVVVEAQAVPERVEASATPAVSPVPIASSTAQNADPLPVTLISLSVGSVIVVLMVSGGAVFATMQRLIRSSDRQRSDGPIVYRLELPGGPVQIVDHRSRAAASAVPAEIPWSSSMPHAAQFDAPADPPVEPIGKTPQAAASTTEQELQILKHVFDSNLALQRSFHRKDAA